MPPISEAALVAELQSKNQKAYTYLYESYSPALFGRITRMVKCRRTAEEILQTVFHKIWLRIESYSPEKSSLYTWMLSIARHESIDYLRSARKKKEIVTYSIDQVNINVLLMPDRQNNRLDFLRSLQKLPHRERVIIELFNMGFTCREIGELLHLPEGSVKTKMRCTYKTLKMLLAS